MKIKFSIKQLELLKEMNFNLDVTDDLTEEQLMKIEEYVSDFFQRKGIDKNDEPNNVGIVCESIIDTLNNL
ncbi:hypothetical protein [Thermoanaerobacterium thermosaccharolyticum]|uniref:hypothetical protein n=1 Tax=Thermoanaerobacterium thermosaccharolyticum TaxID=1517 RepID=UPI003DA8876F